MSDEIPADLIALKREFYLTERELAELSAAMPPPTAVVAGEAEPDLAGQERWNALHERLGELVVEIHRHPALTALDPTARLKLDGAASKAARDTLYLREQPLRPA